MNDYMNKLQEEYLEILNQIRTIRSTKDSAIFKIRMEALTSALKSVEKQIDRLKEQDNGKPRVRFD